MRAYLWAEPHRLGLLLEATGCGTCRVGCFLKAEAIFFFSFLKQIPSQKPGFTDSAGQIFNADVRLIRAMQCQTKQGNGREIATGGHGTETGRSGHEAYENTIKLAVSEHPHRHTHTTTHKHFFPPIGQ